MMKQVAARLGRRPETVSRAGAHSLRRAFSTAPTEARRPTRSTADHASAPTSVAVRAKYPAPEDSVTAAVSYGAWTHANPHLSRQERIEGLRKFMQACDGQAGRHVVPSTQTTATNHRPEPVEAVSQGISCAKQPQSRAERVAQIQRYLDATRATDIYIASHPVTKARYIYGSHSQLDELEPATASRLPDPIADDAPWPAGWRLSSSTEKPVFSYSEWLRSKDGSEMDRVTAARQFLRYARE